MRFLTGFILIAGFIPRLLAGEGMWIPMLLDSLNHEEMKEKGLRISADEIYNINNASLKDAVVMFGNGCTGELISSEGLLITNHHCGYSRISAHSTTEHNYLAEGFWAATKSDELPNPGLTVTFLVRMEDVTSRILEGVQDDDPEDVRTSTINRNIYAVRNGAIQNTHYQAEIKPFYFGKEYYLFVHEVFRDVRLVGTPPEAIGNFGGDTDNWVWPRHTGDFSIFRIYAGKDNKPADYSPENVPYIPKKYFNISMDGISEGDFTMVIGYPAKTDQFLTADALELISEKSLPAKIQMRTARLNAINTIMARGTEEKLRYASKQKNISNAWKKWIGVTTGIERTKTIEEKRKQEAEFSLWAMSSENNRYKTLMKEFSGLYESYNPLYLTHDLASEFLSSIESSPLISQLQIKFFSSADSSEEYRKKLRIELFSLGRSFFKTQAGEIDRMVLPALLRTYDEFAPAEWHPAFYKTINEHYRGDYEAYVDYIFDHSIFTDSTEYFKALKLKDKKLVERIVNDPYITLYRDFSTMLFSDEVENLSVMETDLKRLYRLYVTALMEMDPSGRFYPDANFSMRVAYGEAKNYRPSDAVIYDYYTTLDGIFEKGSQEVDDYKIPDRLQELFNKKDFGDYSINGTVPVCFIASNHTSGGNSGSPVIDGNGNLIGINFDRSWEGTLSDYAYDPEVCRNISLDIRYVLFIIDKYADADWLIHELTIINN